MQLDLEGAPTEPTPAGPRLELLCPLGCGPVMRSEYLAGVFGKDAYGEWAANLVTHYRHNHIRYYDRTWRSWAYRAKARGYVDHDSFKVEVNNRAKRQLVRTIAKRREWPLWRRHLLLTGFLRLQATDQKTCKLIASIRLR